MANNPLTVTYEPGTQIPLALFQGVPLNVLVGTPAGAVDASAVTYTPANPNDWPIPPPGNVAAALDLLAAPRGDYIENAAPVAGVTTFPLGFGGPITPRKSGVYLVWAGAEMDGTGAVGAVASATILVDTIPQGQQQGMGYGPGAWSTLPDNFLLVAVNRAVSHNWTARWDSNSAALFGIAAGRAKMMLLEL